MKSPISFLIIVAIALTSCGKNAEKQSAQPGFDRPDSATLQKISNAQGWQIENVQARDRAFTALESDQQPTDADRQTLLKAADVKKNGFDLSLAMEFSRHISDKYRATVLKWCERNMELTTDPDATVLGYDCYLRSGGTEKDLWASRLKSRGQFYIEKIAEADRKASARKN